MGCTFSTKGLPSLATLAKVSRHLAVAMTRSSQQTYIQRLGFQDKDRANPRHGLACEYLLDRLIGRNFVANILEFKTKAIESYSEDRKQKIVNLENQAKQCEYRLKYFPKAEQEKETILNAIKQEWLAINHVMEIANSIADDKIKQIIYQIMPPSEFISVPISSGKFVNGFADILLNRAPYFYFDGNLNISAYLREATSILGEVKITPEPAENVIQQIAFYREFVHAKEVIVLVDYDAPQLKRMTDGSDIKVYRLGKKFDEWCSIKTNPVIEEF
jgi:hypothetical protein